uniref:Enoyl-CoA hydratase/isomerase n=1 Tax=Timema genevievae TaxID=629358 RepID=A0A7R9K6V0_TIMGE|nr:unnamed protein product [Timema genevievae]
MYEEISIALERAAHNDQIVIVALTGVGEYYSSGNDITSSFGGNMEDVVAAASKKFENLVETFINFPKILVAVVNGPAIGIAVTTLGLCDVVFASDKATFQTPFSKLGLVAEGCSSYMFPMIMGHQRSMSMLCLNTKMNATEAKECGLVTEVFSHRTFQEEVWARLVQYADLPAKSLHTTHCNDLQNTNVGLTDPPTPEHTSPLSSMLAHSWARQYTHFTIHNSDWVLRGYRRPCICRDCQSTLVQSSMSSEFEKYMQKEQSLIVTQEETHSDRWQQDSLLSTKRLIRLHERDALKRACRAEVLQLKEMYFSEDFIKAMLNFSSKRSKL